MKSNLSNISILITACYLTFCPLLQLRLKKGCVVLECSYDKTEMAVQNKVVELNVQIRIKFEQNTPVTQQM